MTLNSNERICIYSYNETEFLNIQEYLLNNGFNWELFKNNALYDTNKKVQKSLNIKDIMHVIFYY